MSRNHADFDLYLNTVRGTRSATIFGKAYTGMPDIPVTLGIQLLDVIMGNPKDDHGTAYTEKETFALFEKTIDFAFGKGTYKCWVEKQMVGADFLSTMIAYIRSGYDAAIINRLVETIQAGDQPLPPDETPAMSTSETTGDTLLPTSGGSTASDSRDLKTPSPGMSSSGSLGASPVTPDLRGPSRRTRKGSRIKPPVNVGMK